MNNLELIGVPILQRREKTKYPLVDPPEWAKQYFKNNPNVSGMAIGGGMNGILGPRLIILNPYTDYNKDSVLKNERLRHYFDESNFKLPNITKEQMNKYKGTPYEGDSLNIGRTEASRYLSGDKHLLTRDQIKYIEEIDIPSFKKGNGIHIKKKNRGKFTEYCGGEVTQECIDKAKKSKNPTLRKRATFALNSRKWSKKGLNGLKFGWKALDNINFKAIPDTTFTRDKTGIGDIEYFNPKYPGIRYPNGYYKKHPSPGEHVILYNPNNNDMLDIRLDALHIMPEDATYDALNTLYRNAARTSDVSHNAKMRYNEDVEKFGKENTDSYELYFNNEADGLLRNMFIEGTPEYIQSKRYYPDIDQLRKWNKPLLPYIDEIHKYLKTGKRPSHILPEITVTPEFKTGGSIPKFQTPASPIKRLDINGLRNDPEYKKNFNWKMHDDNLALIQDSLIARNADYPERVAVLGLVIPESGGYTEDHGNGASGYVGWRGSRAINLPKDAPGQAHKLMSEIYDNPTAKDWSHGGIGTGVQTGKEMMNLFLNTLNVQLAGKAFMKGYVRPEKSEYEKRLQFLKLLKKYMK